MFYPTQEMQIWDDEMFLKMFRFWGEQFTELLIALLFGDAGFVVSRLIQAKVKELGDICPTIREHTTISCQGFEFT